MRIGGIDVPHDKSAIAHSDGDVLLHAVIDALLGAAALGDIGQMFPDTDLTNKDRDSAEMLSAALDAVRSIGLSVGNVDCIIHAQRPKMLPYRQAIRERLAEVLGIEPEQVGLKSKTGENIGPVGQQLLIEAQCVALLVPSKE